jgi:hypothetical protein
VQVSIDRVHAEVYEDDDAHDESQKDEENDQCIEDDVDGGRQQHRARR